MDGVKRRKRMWLVACLLLAACGGSNPPPPPVVTGPWVFQYSPGMNAPAPDGQGGYYFDFPAADGVHYLVQQRFASLSGTMTLTGSIAFVGAPVFQSSDPSSLACGSDPHVDLYLQWIGDDGQNEFGRWWAVYRQPIVSGDFTYAVPLVSDQWSDVYAHQDATQFAVAIAAPQAVGMTFGVGCFAGHGTYVNGGLARFTIKSFSLQ